MGKTTETTARDSITATVEIQYCLPCALPMREKKEPINGLRVRNQEMGKMLETSLLPRVTIKIPLLSFLLATQ